jgi:hypothetical protein
MKLREFNKNLKIITKNKKIDESKILPFLSSQVRSDMVYFIVRNRQPVLKSLIPEGFDLSWLACMGYLYETRGKTGYTFIHTCEHRIK